MPGLSQLRQFSEDIKELGDEVRIRRMRGEQPIFVPVPDVPDTDDSQEFMLGMPDPHAAPSDAGSSAPVAASAADFSDVDLSALGEIPGLSVGAPAAAEPVAMPPELADILGGAVGGETSALDDMPDLSDFMDDISAPVPAEPAPVEPDAAAAGAGSAEERAPEKENAVPLDQGELDKLFASMGAPSAPREPDVAADTATTSDEAGSAEERAPEKENAVPLDQGELDKLFASMSAPSVSEPTAEPADEASSAMPSFTDEASGTDGMPLGDETDEIDAAAAAGDVSALDDLPPIDDLSLPDDFGEGDDLQEPDDVPEIADLADLDLDGEASPVPSAEEPASSAGSDTGEDSLAGFSLPDDFGLDAGFGGESSGTDGSAETSAALPDEISLGDDFSLGDDGSAPSAGGGAGDMPSFDDMLSGLDVPEMGGGNDGGAAPAPTDSVPDAGLDLTPEVFDTSEMEGLDFSAGGGSSALPFDEEFPVTGEGGDDFELTDDFEIPGFSDTDTVPVDKKKGGFRLDSPDFSKAADADRPKNTLTDEEYAQFKKNLAGYPLNLRVAIEDFIVKDEFKDDVIFEVIEKVLKKGSARQVAGHLEKLLDISIDVPRDYERRSVAQYEAYKQSFQYQLKNRILPAAIAGVFLVIFGVLLFQAGKRFVYQPLMAKKLYKQGYTMLENNEYPQSEKLFQEATDHKAIKKWFFTYAEGYRAHRQYERAAQMYERILRRFKNDKKGGLDYAGMELYERANYPRAEEIVRREVLDHHINDPDGLLLLGDTFLEWAEIDPEKYELARAEYSNLIQLYGATDLYMSRMMRYFIRTDNLPNVLSLKNRFYAKKKSLGADDWTELSGYLLDKLYGNLSKSEEYLRSSIEDVLDMLETAVKLNPTNPVARYNLSRYFLHNGNDASAQREMQLALDMFSTAPVRTKKNTYREINGYRILGELFSGKREYIKAQEAYTRGINVYTDEHGRTGLAGDENVGKLYADLGDIDYFIAGDMDAALDNYRTAVDMKNDTPSLNYRIGAIFYQQQNYDKALGSFIRTSEQNGTDPNLLLSLGNTLSLRGDNFAAQGYYSDLLVRLDGERARRTMLSPQSDEDDNLLVDMYLKANNNLGVTLYRLARQTGDSGKNAEALVRLSDSIRAWDALTRNPETMKRMEGSNLAAQNSQYIMHTRPDFEPAIYTDIPKTLSNEKGLK